MRRTKIESSGKRRAQILRGVWLILLLAITLCPPAARAFSPTADGFVPDIGPSEPLNAMVQLSAPGMAPGLRETLMVGGAFTQLGGLTEIGIGHVWLDGKTWGTYPPRTNGTVWSMASEPGGKVLFGGAFSELKIGSTFHASRGIARLKDWLLVDPSFRADVDGAVFAIVPQPDGKILIGGCFGHVDGVARNHVARLNPDGSLDPTFDPGYGADGFVWAIALRPDGKVVLGGEFNGFDGYPRAHLALLGADGALDPDYNPVANDVVRALLLQPDGRLVVAGDFAQIAGAAAGRVARLLPDGRIDPGFHRGPGASSRVLALARQTDGGILAAGTFAAFDGVPQGKVVRLRLDGTPDPAFHSPAIDGEVRTLLVQRDGRIALGGAFSEVGGLARRHMARLLPNGSNDTTFHAEADDSVLTTAVQADGRSLIGGRFMAVGGVSTGTLARLELDGTVDSSFTPGANSTVKAIAVQPDGQILIGGAFDRVGGVAKSYLARLNADGSLDAGFLASGLNGDVHGFVLLDNGQILISGLFTQVGGLQRNFIARLNADGTVDPAFNAWVGAGAPDHRVQTVRVQPDHKILIGGLFNTVGSGHPNCIARLNPDGSLDPSFNSFATFTVRSILWQWDDKILIAGDFESVGPNRTPIKYLARLNPDGSVDPTFNPHGPNSGLETMQLLTDGTIQVGGRFTQYDWYLLQYLAWLDPNGRAIGTSNPDGPVYSIAQHGDGRETVAGELTQIEGVPFAGLGRLWSRYPVTDDLTSNAYGDTINWRRGGAGPELERVTFEVSTDGVNYRMLGDGTWMYGSSWQLRFVDLPWRQNLWIRARGIYSTGLSNGSSSILESVRQIYLANGPEVEP